MVATSFARIGELREAVDPDQRSLGPIVTKRGSEEGHLVNLGPHTGKHMIRVRKNAAVIDVVDDLGLIKLLSQSGTIFRVLSSEEEDACFLARAWVENRAVRSWHPRISLGPI